MVTHVKVDLNLFRVLHHVLKEGSVGRAADCLHVTSSAVSNSLARLREILGDPLLVRNGRTLVPTPRAMELTPQLAAAMDGFRSVLDASSLFDSETCTRTMTIASADNVGVGILPGIVARFSKRLPRAKLRVVTLDHAIASGGLASGEVDILLGLPPSLPRELRSAPAYTDRLVCARCRSHGQRGRKITLKQFLSSRHIEVALQGKHPIDYVDKILADLGHSRSIALSVPHFMTAAMCVIGTSYIAMIPQMMANRLAHFLPLTICEPPFAVPPITILQVWHSRTDADPALRVLRSIVRDRSDDCDGRRSHGS
jgi:DNA-binding transcriptional LysR family regulator